ncbi:MAG: DUF1501 domain-containing protein [Planctomycetes bacterium]|nr:DUF1501 domain-containing protein [Planctomycetota bacterium]
MNHENCEHTNADQHGLDRRQFLGRSVIGATAALTAPAWLPRVSFAAGAGPSPRDTLVVIFLRGGADGMTFCAPYGDGELYNRRPTLAIRPPGQANGAINLDGFFGLAPAMAPLLTPYQAGNLAFVHASGLSDPSRSHFDMQKWMEFGVPGAQATTVSNGWLGRYLQTIAPSGPGLLRGIGIASILPRGLSGGPAVQAVPNPAAFVISGSTSTAAARRAAIAAAYAQEPDPMSSAAANTFAAMDLMASINFTTYVPANGAVYPATTFGTALRNAAAIIKAQIGVEVIEVDLGGWDLHNQLGPTTGAMATLMGELAGAMRAFHDDLNDVNQTLNRVTTVALSEFGRRASENGSFGIDHGHGNAMIVMGGHVNGGQVIRVWPGLALPNLDNGDLAITIDYRDILSEILVDRMACTSLPAVFPGWTMTNRGITN